MTLLRNILSKIRLKSEKRVKKMNTQEKSSNKNNKKKSTLLKLVESGKLDKLKEMLDKEVLSKGSKRDLDKTIRICLKNPDKEWGGEDTIKVLIQKYSPYMFDPKLGESTTKYPQYTVFTPNKPVFYPFYPEKRFYTPTE